MMSKIMNFLSNLKIVKKIKLEMSFKKSTKVMERRNFKPAEVDGSEMNSLGIIIKHDHDYVRGTRNVISVSRFVRKNKNEKYTVIYVDDDYYKLSSTGKKFAIEQEIAKVTRVVDDNGGYYYATNKDLRKFNSTTIVDRDVVRTIGLLNFEDGMREIAKVIGTSGIKEQCESRCRHVANYMSNTVYKTNRPILRGRDIVAALYDNYGEGMYNILPKHALMALNKIVF